MSNRDSLKFYPATPFFVTFTSIYFERSRLPNQPATIPIGFVTTELGVGGAERCLTNLATQLDSSRFRPVIYSLAAPPAKHRSELIDQLATAQLPIHFLNSASKWSYFSVVRRLSHLLKEQRPEILQTFLFHANILGTHAAKRAKVPHILTGIRVADPSRPRQYYERVATRNVDKIVCVSQAVAQFQESIAGFQARKLAVIPNGIDVQRMDESKPMDITEFGIPHNRRILTFVGRLQQQKGVDWLIEMAPQLLTPLADFDLLIVGDGPQRTQLESLANSSGIRNRIHFVGRQSNIPGILKRSELLLLPSRWEGMPNVIMEAMACGLPVVSTKAHGVIELLGPHADAQTVAFNDEATFLSLVKQFCQIPTHAQRLGKLNRERVQNHFSLTTMVQHYEALYASLTEPHEP